MEPVSWLPTWISWPLFWITTHQTLLTGAAAIYVAWRTVDAIRTQMRQSAESEHDVRRRRHLATIAGLPISFVEVMEYANDCWDTWVSLLNKWDAVKDWDGKEHVDFGIIRPEFPYDAFHNIRAAIETANAEDAEKLSDLLAFGQIQLSRFSKLISQFHVDSIQHDTLVTKINVSRAARDALELHFRASRGLRYARRHTAHIEDLPNFTAVEEFLFFLPASLEDELRDYLSKVWHQHWHTIKNHMNDGDEEAA